MSTTSQKSNLSKIADRYITRLPIFMSLVVICSFVGSSLGFKVVTPQSDIVRIERNDASIRMTVDSLRKYLENHEMYQNRQMREMSDSIEVNNKLTRALAVGECIDRPITQTQMMQLPCEALGIRKRTTISNGEAAPQ